VFNVIQLDLNNVTLLICIDMDDTFYNHYNVDYCMSNDGTVCNCSTTVRSTNYK
jgi:hypothetical protein